MKLIEEEQEILDGKKGDTAQKAMELLAAVGECYLAERMVSVTSSHMSSV